MKNAIPKKNPVLFSRPKKIPASFIDPKKSFGPPPPPPVIKICEWGPWDDNGGDAVGIDGDIGGDDNRVLKCDVIKN